MELSKGLILMVSPGLCYFYPLLLYVWGLSSTEPIQVFSVLGSESLSDVHNVRDRLRGKVNEMKAGFSHKLTHTHSGISLVMHPRALSQCWPSCHPSAAILMRSMSSLGCDGPRVSSGLCFPPSHFNCSILFVHSTSLISFS